MTTNTTSTPDNIFAAADAGLRPTATPAVKPEDADIANTLKTVGIGHPEQSAPGAQAGTQADGATHSPDADPRDEYFRPHNQVSMFNDIKARPMDGQGQDGTEAQPTTDNAKVVA